MNRFYKFHGLGNDFIIFEENCQINFNINLIKLLCNRYKGIGADGIILLIQNNNLNNYEIKIYNSDGSIAKICGNGIRCIVKFIYERENQKKQEKGEIIQENASYEILTEAGIVQAKVE